MLRSKYLVGHVDYLSKISGKLEKLPVAVSILGSARKSPSLSRDCDYNSCINLVSIGEDLRLLKTVKQCLVASNRPTVVATGKTMF